MAQIAGEGRFSLVNTDGTEIDLGPISSVKMKVHPAGPAQRSFWTYGQTYTVTLTLDPDTMERFERLRAAAYAILLEIARERRARRNRTPALVGMILFTVALAWWGMGI